MTKGFLTDAPYASLQGFLRESPIEVKLVEYLLNLRNYYYILKKNPPSWLKIHLLYPETPFEVNFILDLWLIASKKYTYFLSLTN